LLLVRLMRPPCYVRVSFNILNLKIFGRFEKKLGVESMPLGAHLNSVSLNAPHSIITTWRTSRFVRQERHLIEGSKNGYDNGP
jgi:hypothetical protein